MTENRFKFRAAMKTADLCIIVPVENILSTGYIIDMNIAKEVFEKKYPEKCFFSDFLEIIEKHEYVSQYSFDSDLLITKDFTNLMQCTGNEDKNGTLIFDEDIVKKKGNKYLSQITFNQESSAFCYSDEQGIHFFYHRTAEKLEVLGNIYENPELLKGRQA